jgi:transcription termination factor NusB
MSYRDDRKRDRDGGRDTDRGRDHRRRADDRRDERRDDRREERRDRDRHRSRDRDRDREDHDRRRDRRRDDEDKKSSRKSSRRPSHSPQGNRKRGNQPSAGGPRNLRIDRHECRKSAIDFLIRNADISDRYSNERIEDMIDDFIRTLEMDYDYYAFTVEILKGLLIDRKYTVITDRWVMGILDEHLQAELKVPDLTILRVAGFELLTHPEIPTTVVINEVNVLSKMYCPDKQSLIHAAVNRMIETQQSIGNELAVESGEGRRKGKDDPMQLLAGLDQESQLAILLLEQTRRQKKRERRRSRSVSSSSSSDRRSPSPKRVRAPEPEVLAKQAEAIDETMEDGNTFFSQSKLKTGKGLGGIKISYSATFDVPASSKPDLAKQQHPKENRSRVDASSQTVRDPLIEPGVRVFRITM